MTAEREKKPHSSNFLVLFSMLEPGATTWSDRLDSCCFCFWKELDQNFGWLDETGQVIFRIFFDFRGLDAFGVESVLLALCCGVKF